MVVEIDDDGELGDLLDVFGLGVGAVVVEVVDVVVGVDVVADVLLLHNK